MAKGGGHPPLQAHHPIDKALADAFGHGFANLVGSFLGGAADPKVVLEALDNGVDELAAGPQHRGGILCKTLGKALDRVFTGLQELLAQLLAQFGGARRRGLDADLGGFVLEATQFSSVETSPALCVGQISQPLSHAADIGRSTCRRSSSLCRIEAFNRRIKLLDDRLNLSGCALIELEDRANLDLVVVTTIDCLLNSPEDTFLQRLCRDRVTAANAIELSRHLEGDFLLGQRLLDRFQRRPDAGGVKTCANGDTSLSLSLNPFQRTFGCRELTEERIEV